MTIEARLELGHKLFIEDTLQNDKSELMLL